jgi:hypothetical protein
LAVSVITAAAAIISAIPAMAILLGSKGWDFGSPGQAIGHELISLINHFD